MGLNRTLMGINPSYSPLPLASTYAAPMAANAVTAALIHREVKGIGDHIEVPLLEVLLEGLGANALKHGQLMIEIVEGLLVSCRH